MAGYGNYNRGGYGNGGYQRNNYGGNQQGGYQPKSTNEPTPPPPPEEYIKNKLDMYQLFKNKIIEQGYNPDEFAFGLMAWVTGYEMAQLKYEEAMKKYKGQ